MSRSERPGAARALLSYNVARLALLLAVLGVLYAVGLRGFPWLLAALLVSGLLSWFLLRPLRLAMGEGVERLVHRRLDGVQPGPPEPGNR
jgi:hypothetical protein